MDRIQPPRSFRQALKRDEEHCHVSGIPETWKFSLDERQPPDADPIRMAVYPQLYGNQFWGFGHGINELVNPYVSR